MIVRFTNVKGEVNHEIIVATDLGGMIEVLWEPFTALIDRLAAGNRLGDFERIGLS